MILFIVASLLFLTLSAFFSGSETALIASSRARMHTLAKANNKRAKIVTALTKNNERLMGGILFGNNLANVAVSSTATYFLLNALEPLGLSRQSILFGATLFITLIIFMFAEVLPKSLALRQREAVALLVAPILRFFLILFSPISQTLHNVISGILNLLKIPMSTHTKTATGEELKGNLQLYALQGTLSKTDKNMIDAILDLDDIKAEDIMVHRTNIQSLELCTPWDEVLIFLKEQPFSRFPVVDGEIDNVVGVVLARDILQVGTYNGLSVPHRVPQKKTSSSLKALMKEPWFISEHTTSREVLRGFRKKRSHLALVVDEYGSLQGLVTLEDILEEIIGDIEDEYDIPEVKTRSFPDGSHIIHGDTSVRDINRQFDWELPEDNAPTIAGLLLNAFQKMPSSGDSMMLEGLKFEVLRVQDQRLHTILVHPLERKRS